MSTTFLNMTRRLANLIQQNRAMNEGRHIMHVSDFTEYDKECIDTLCSQLRRLFIDNDGRTWEHVLHEIKNIAGWDFYLGFNAQDTIIKTCENYGLIYPLMSEVRV